MNGALAMRIDDADVTPERSPILVPGRTCWRTERADRIAVMMDGEAYFSAAKSAILNAKRSVFLAGWQFDARTRLEPSNGRPGVPDTIGEVLNHAVAANPALDVRLLIWDVPLFIAAAHNWFPHRAKYGWLDERILFRVDGNLPGSACHHQKILVVDDRIAFCGGMDFAPNRWDSREHIDQDPRRRVPSGKICPPRHDVMMLMEGDAAIALGELVRDRWHRAGGEKMADAVPAIGESPWPIEATPMLADAEIGISRTQPEWYGGGEVRENEALHETAIAAAQDLIVLENQYFASGLMADALVKRLKEPNGPEIVLICSGNSPGTMDALTMDSPRDMLVSRLRDADVHGRFSALAPRTSSGRNVIVHSKIAIIDDRLLRIGSTNINNRSMGYDTECDVAIEAADGPDGEKAREAIARFRADLIGHYLRRTPDEVIEACRDRTLAEAVALLDDGPSRRLSPVDPGKPSLLHTLAARLHLFDPMAHSDAWKPWRRATARIERDL